MAQLSYMNPSAASPYGDWQPQGFLAGFQYQDRLKDYQTQRDLINQASYLANVRSQQQIQAAQAEAPLQALQRQHQMELLPLEHMTKISEAKVQSAAAQLTEGQRASQIMFDTSERYKKSQRQSVLEDALSMSGLVKGYSAAGLPVAQIWPQILREAKRMKIPTADFENLSSEEIQKTAQYFTLLDENHLKQLRDMSQISAKEEAHMARTKAEVAGRERVAEISAGKTSAAGVKEANLEKWAAKFVELRTKQQQRTQLTAQEQSELEAAQIRMRDYFYQQGAVIQRSEENIKRGMAVIQQEETGPAPTTAPTRTQKPSFETVTIPNVGEVEVLNRYEDGSFKFRDPKTGKIGTATPK